MKRITAAEKILIFSKYIGQQVVITNLLDDIEIGFLLGVRDNAVLVEVNKYNRWIPLSDEITLCDIKLILKPLKKLTPQIIKTANSLPVQAFITPYYQSLGFDMPVFISPGHPCNCRYVQEIGLADYRTPAEIRNQHQMAAVHAG
ncbi:hypothetical protein EOD41_15555 [Mucilaginibacter limnophilus]|uniref:Uncharacterized protein n=1 Tax=Mucilaginibacter limnophilus TaxID=1932778 RepID=A0A3S2V6U9_9SPHI|nr:hypothetical protein [Mucilaginibacter limnophilus]RVT99855.1 hypothetical protein EOD41_15555 [Mucilaginibacter limnophilus]